MTPCAASCSRPPAAKGPTATGSRCACATARRCARPCSRTFLRDDKLRGTPAATSFGRLAEAAAVLRNGGAGSLELAWVAAGHIDGWAQPNVDAWDWLPGRLLVQEAGGRTAVIDGDPLAWFVAAAPGTFDELVALVSAGR